tara:strand:- start:40 stop:213 length:174 start_codon:yes stop_codon:yes gene_type:complete
MNIKSVKKANDVVGNFDHYILTDNNNKIFNVPLDEDNRHYQAIQKWIADGNTIEEAD